MDVRKLFFVVAMLAAATTPSYATTITYNFAARIDVAVAPTPDFTLESVQTGDVLHGTMTINTSLPDLNASPDIGQYVAMSVLATFAPDNAAARTFRGAPFSAGR